MAVLNALIRRFICTTLLLMSSALMSVGASQSSPLSGLIKQGEGTMSVLFWDLYSAEYYLPSKTDSAVALPQVLKITYLRDIEKDDLVKATLEQWQHIELNHANQTNWLQKLTQIWPDISKKDTLLLRIEQDGSSHFYHQSANDRQLKKIGSITDTEFGTSFLAIWLSPKTSRPDLRAQLLGLNL
ncbi:chalcone isomerase family protein [Catenovulum agarivorans]|nr:chalcone isomerase family protein [Catenovulum agarivorans]